MYIEAGELATYHLFMSDAAMIRASAAEGCEFCNTDAAAAGWDATAKLNWLRNHRPDLATAMLDEPSGHVWYDAHDEATREVWDSRVEPTIGIPEELIALIEPGLTPELRDFIQDRFVFAICGHCLADTKQFEKFGVNGAIKRYIQVHFDGNEEVAARENSWALAQELASRLSSALQRYGTTG
jgi:hypothetical protein